MRSKIAQRILDQTSEETKRKVQESVNRRLAQELDLNVEVVDRAIDNLVRMGLVEVRKLQPTSSTIVRNSFLELINDYFDEMSRLENKDVILFANVPIIVFLSLNCNSLTF